MRLAEIKLLEEENKFDRLFLDRIGFRDGGNINAQGLNIVSLKGCPDNVNNLYVQDNLIDSLEFFPKNVQGNISLSGNKITSFKGLPRLTMGALRIAGNPITSFEGCPRDIGGNLNIANTKITSFHNIHKFINSINGMIYAHCCDLQDSMLGLLKIQGLTSIIIDDSNLSSILNSFIGTGDLLACQQELIDKGFEDFAKL